MLAALLSLLTQLNYKPLHEAGYMGDGMTIAVIDAGFYRANDPTVFPQNQIIGWYDLLQGEPNTTDTIDMFSNPQNYHGTACLSTMLYHDSMFVGTAPHANYILIRTEDYYQETREEVDRLIRGLQLADSLGVDVVTISLGYTLFDDTLTNYTYADMDGRGAAAQAVLNLARHDILVCVAMGNDGNNSWHYLSTPADADSIISVGAADINGNPCSFSSYGPTADGRVKPEVIGWGGNCIIYNPSYRDPETGKEGILGYSNGTSYSTPQIAGLATCLRQALPHLSAMEIRQIIIESASFYPQWTDQLGYGIPDFGYAYNGTKFNDIEQLIGSTDNSPKAAKIYLSSSYGIVIKKGGEMFTPLGIKIN